jgi:hypothetical protein
MKLAQTAFAALTIFLASCSKQEHVEAKNKEDVVETDNLNDWIQFVEDQYKTYGDPLPLISKLLEDKKIIYLIQLERTKDTNRNLFSICKANSEFKDIFETEEQFILYITNLEPKAIICYFGSDSVETPVFPFSQMSRIRSSILKNEQEFIFFPGG